MKAHLLNAGDVEGPGMAMNLKSSRRAIGAKFAQDGAQAKVRHCTIHAFENFIKSLPFYTHIFIHFFLFFQKDSKQK